MIHYVSCELLNVDGDDALLEIKYRVDGGEEIYKYQFMQYFSVEDGFVYLGTFEFLNGHRPESTDNGIEHHLIGDTLQDHVGYE